MFSHFTLALITALLFHLSNAQENCYRARRPFKSACALPDLQQMRTTLCSSTDNWGEGFPFLSGHGVVLRLQDNCTADDAPLGIDLTMTISSTIKNRTDCLARTASILDRCVDKGGPATNGGEWYDLVEEGGKTFIWMQYQHIDPPSPPNPCYEYPPPPYCTAYPEPPTKRGQFEVRSEETKRKELSLRGMHIDVDAEGKVLRKRFVRGDETVEELE